MKALTVQQPWAWAIVHGGKSPENRSRNIAGGYRGPLAIHAGLREDEAGFGVDLIQEAFGRYDDSWVLEEQVGQRGAIVGVVDLVAVHQGHNTERGRMRAVASCFQAGRPYGPCSPWAEPDVRSLSRSRVVAPSACGRRRSRCVRSSTSCWMSRSGSTRSGRPTVPTDLERELAHARAMAKAAHKPECRDRYRRMCEDCVGDADRALWQRIADEIDQHLHRHDKEATLL